MGRVCMVVAANNEGVIGYRNTLPWHIPMDLKHFKQLTLGKAVIMGRRTFESLPVGLPGRELIVLSRSTQALEGASVIHTPHVPAHLADKTVFIIGGAEVYLAYEHLIDEIHLTVVNKDVRGDTYLPFAIEQPHWVLSSTEYRITPEGTALCFQVWTRRPYE